MIGFQPQKQQLDAYSQKIWDVIVIGAGPAGSLCANLLADRGLAVLLVESKAFPRDKVCGGCLNRTALAVLDECGLTTLLHDIEAVPLKSIRLTCRRRSANWALPETVVVDRARFDQALANAAITSGATFLTEATAEIVGDVCRNATPQGESLREVRLKRKSESAVAQARLVVCATGLASSCLRRLPEFGSHVAAASRIGMGAVVADTTSNFPAGTLTMAVDTSGYVGVARLADGRLNMAAAVDARQLALASEPAELIGSVLRNCGFPVPEAVPHACWNGTPALTRSSSRVATERVLLIGDAAGYVEPFTGEGMGWGLLSAFLVAPLVVRAAHLWDEDVAVEWEQSLNGKVLREQWMCRLLSGILRRPQLTGGLLTVLRHLPRLSERLLTSIGRSPLTASSRRWSTRTLG